jgi:hypothetical protein
VHVEVQQARHHQESLRLDHLFPAAGGYGADRGDLSLPNEEIADRVERGRRVEKPAPSDEQIAHSPSS